MTELDCVIGVEPVALTVTSLEKIIWDEAFVDKFTDGAIAVVVVACTAVNVWLRDIPNLEVSVVTTLWPEADDSTVDELLMLESCTSEVTFVKLNDDEVEGVTSIIEKDEVKEM